MPNADFTYQLSRSAERYFGRLPEFQQRRISHRLEQLCEDPYAGSISAPLVGRGGERRARVGDLRIVYFVDEAALTVEVTAIGPRGDVYG